MQRRHLTGALAAAIAAPAILIGCATAPSDAEVATKATAMLKVSFSERGQAKLDRLAQDLAADRRRDGCRRHIDRGLESACDSAPIRAGDAS